MHSKVLLVFLALIPILPLIFLASPVPVHAASITVANTSGTVGTSIQINGSGFAGHFATILWDDQIILDKVPISTTGELAFKFKVPPACKGNHSLKIVDDSNWGVSTASTIFTVLPGITILSNYGPSNTKVTVVGNGFAASEKDIRVTWDGDVLPPSTKANHLGSWSIDFNIPETRKGEHFISAFSSATDASEIGEFKFIVTRYAKVEPTSGPVGTEVTINGFGFRVGEDGITITWDGEIILCNLVAEADGSWITTLSIPPSTHGHHIIGVYGSSFTPKGIVPDTDFNVVSDIKLQPASGNKGAKVTVNGSGFAGDEAITISFNEMTLDTKATADNVGSFSATFEAPQSKVQDNKVEATGNDGNSAQAIFIIEKIAPDAPNLLSPKQGAKLESFPSVGDVFLGTAKHLIGIIALRNPRQQSFGAARTTFDWTDVDDKGNVSYTLQIAHDGNFSSPALTRESLAESEYTLSKEDSLTKDIYSWRVKAVDDIGNESPWSETQEFELGSMSTRVFAISLAIPVFLIAAIVAIAILTWRAKRIKR
jgi:hypothetical protein